MMKGFTAVLKNCSIWRRTISHFCCTVRLRRRKQNYFESSMPQPLTRADGIGNSHEHGWTVPHRNILCPHSMRKVRKQNCDRIGREQTQFGRRGRRRFTAKFGSAITKSERNDCYKSETSSLTHFVICAIIMVGGGDIAGRRRAGRQRKRERDPFLLNGAWGYD